MLISTLTQFKIVHTREKLIYTLLTNNNEEVILYIFA